MMACPQTLHLKNCPWQNVPVAVLARKLITKSLNYLSFNKKWKLKHIRMYLKKNYLLLLFQK